MEMIDRYVYAVGMKLPHKKRQDIMAELRSSLYDELDDLYGDQINEEQVIELLEHYGPPDKVVASYYSEGHYLIGPDLYPVFSFTMGLSLFVMFCILAFDATMSLLRGESVNILKLIGDSLTGFSAVLTALVLFFAIIQRFGQQKSANEAHWDPRNLPTLAKPDQVNRRAVLTRLIFEIMILVGLISVFLFSGKATSQVLSISAIGITAPWIVLIIILDLLLNLFLLYSVQWNLGLRVARIVINIASALLIYLFLYGNNFPLEQSSDTDLTAQIGIAFTRTLWYIIMIICTFEAFIVLYHLISKIRYDRTMLQEINL